MFSSTKSREMMNSEQIRGQLQYSRVRRGTDYSSNEITLGEIVKCLAVGMYICRRVLSQPNTSLFTVNKLMNEKSYKFIEKLLKLQKYFFIKILVDKKIRRKVEERG